MHLHYPFFIEEFYIFGKMNQIISVLGCGWYGLPLAQSLVAAGHQVKGSTTSPDKLEILQKNGIQPFLIDLQESSETTDLSFFNCDVLVICIPPKRSSGEQSTYPIKIDNIRQAAKNRSSKVIFISSTSVYGETNSEIDETVVTAAHTASGKAMLESENLLLQEDSFATTVLRFAGLVGPGRNPGRFFTGKQNIPNGQAPINLIHLTDCIQLTMALIQQDVFGHIFNACSPDHPQKQHFYTKAAAVSGLPLPQFIDELGDWKVILSEKSSSILNYKYVIDNWSEWLEQDID